MAIWPSDSCLGNLAASQANIDGKFALREVALGGHDLTRNSASILGAQVDPGSDGFRITFWSDYLQSDPMVPQGLVIAEQQRGPMDLGHDHVEVSVPIKICIGRSSTYDGLEEVFTGFGSRGADERLIASTVPEELGRLPVVDIGLHLLDVIFDVSIGGQDIEPSIQVIVEKEETKLEEQSARRPETFRNGLVSEDQGIFCRLGHIEGIHFIGEIADGDAQRTVRTKTCRVDAHGPASLSVGVEGHAALGPHLLEGSIVPVGEDEVLDGVIGHYEVHPTVVIQIDRSHREGFGHGQPRGRILDTETASG